MGNKAEEYDMGFMDKLSGKPKPSMTDTIKPVDQVIQENGIDTSTLEFKYHQDGTVEVSGTAVSQEECDRICELIRAMPTTTGVQNNMNIAAPGSEPATNT